MQVEFCEGHRKFEAHISNTYDLCAVRVDKHLHGATLEVCRWMLGQLTDAAAMAMADHWEQETAIKKRRPREIYFLYSTRPNANGRVSMMLHIAIAFGGARWMETVCAGFT